MVGAGSGGTLKQRGIVLTLDLAKVHEAYQKRAKIAKDKIR